MEPRHPYEDGLGLPGRHEAVLLASSRNGISMEHADGWTRPPPLDLRAQTSSVSKGTQRTAEALQIYTHPFLMLQYKTSKAPRHQEQGPWISREQQQQELGLFLALPGT